MPSFSERMGLVEVRDILQTNAMSDELRNRLWNVINIHFWKRSGFMGTSRRVTGYFTGGEFELFSHLLWDQYFRKPIDSIPNNNIKALEFIHDYYFYSPWNEVYDLIEFMIGEHPEIQKSINYVLKKELAGYTLIEGQFVPITDEQEIKTLEDALSDDQFSNVTTHLKQALSLLSDRENPDFRDSIKESISAVECMAKIFAQDKNATLGEALNVLSKNGNKIHPAQLKAFNALYGYTAQADGIRHALVDEANLDQSDAKYFLITCTSFINYLKARYSEQQ